MTVWTTDPDRAFERRLLDEMPRVRAMLGRLAPADAEDLAQETAARALRYRGSFSADRSVGAWLSGIAFRLYLDHRARRRVRPMEDEPVEEDLRAESRDRLDVALARLSSTERELVLRFHARAESIAEIAAATGLPPGTVKSHLHRARRKMARAEEER